MGARVHQAEEATHTNHSNKARESTWNLGHHEQFSLTRAQNESGRWVETGMKRKMKSFFAKVACA